MESIGFSKWSRLFIQHLEVRSQIFTVLSEDELTRRFSQPQRRRTHFLCPVNVNNDRSGFRKSHSLIVQSLDALKSFVPLGIKMDFTVFECSARTSGATLNVRVSQTFTNLSVAVPRECSTHTTSTQFGALTLSVCVAVSASWT